MTAIVGSLEANISIDSMQVNALHINPPRRQAEKIFFPIKYKHTDFTLPSVILMLPPLKIKYYSAETRLLELSAESIVSKMVSIQDFLCKTLLSKPSWLGTANIKESDFQSIFQPILKNNSLTIFIHPKTWLLHPHKQEGELLHPHKQEGKLLHPHKQDSLLQNGSWLQGDTSRLSIGATIYISLRLQGLLVLPATAQGKRCRIQHLTLGIFF